MAIEAQETQNIGMLERTSNQQEIIASKINNIKNIEFIVCLQYTKDSSQAIKTLKEDISIGIENQKYLAIKIKLVDTT